MILQNQEEDEQTKVEVEVKDEQNKVEVEVKVEKNKVEKKTIEKSVEHRAWRTTESSLVTG